MSNKPTGNQIVYQGNNKDHIIGRGTFGYVFVGKLNDKEVAVKRVQLIDVIEREEEAFKKLDQHENVVQLFHAENEQQFR